MKIHRGLGIAIMLAFLLVFVISVGTVGAKKSDLSRLEQLGKFIFFDTRLSEPEGQACATCHAPEVGFTGPDSVINLETAIYPGALEGRFGNRKPPSAAYAGDSPLLDFDEDEELWIGGMFWDGRATGWVLGDPLAEQAQGPFLNPLEQNMPDKESVCLKIQQADYAVLFKQVFDGRSLLCKTQHDIDLTYDRIAFAIAAYERSAEVNPFSSKFDAVMSGHTNFNAQEARGYELYLGKAMCDLCHLSTPGPNGEPALFSDFTYDNLGVPRNPDNPFYDQDDEYNPDGDEWVDTGLGGFLKSIGEDETGYMAEWGKVKVPTLRNVDLRPYDGFVKAYGHNGYFKSLESIVHFYNTRDVLGDCAEVADPKEGVNCWPAPEIPENVNTDELGNLELTLEEETDLVAFLRTLSDGYPP